MAAITENRHAEGFIVSEANGRRSRDQATLLSGQKVPAGTVLGAVLGTTATATALRVNAGNGTFGTITVAAPARVGNYMLNMQDATHFAVTDPGNREIGNGTTGVAFTADGIGFTLTAGGTPFAAGDAFMIAVTGKKAAYDPTANDGREIADSIALNDTDATSADHAIGIFARNGEVNQSELVWGANVTTAAQQAAGVSMLASRDIVAR